MKVKTIGLTEEEVALSREKHGNNSLSKEKTKGFFRRFFENLSDPIIKILLIALVVEIVITFGNCNYFEIGGILVSILISATVSTVSEYTSEKSFEKLREDEEKRTIRVLRDGIICNISPNDIVIGDVIYLSAGDKIFADGELIEGEISVDQSALNGESAECHKYPVAEKSFDILSRSKVFRGTVVTSGSAIMRVLRIGEKTYYGMVARDVQTETRTSPLKNRLSKLAEQISRIGYIAAALVGIAYLFNILIVDNSFDFNLIVKSVTDLKYISSILIKCLTLMITVVVVAAPEGLPMMITVVLSANMKKLIADKVLVKKLIGIETAGSLNILFTDKTGTVTEGEPRCERIICDAGIFTSPKELRDYASIHRYLCLCAKYNTDVVKRGNEETGGNSTDRSIYRWFQNEDCGEVEIYDKLSFTSQNKYSRIRIKNEKMIIKGAAEMLISASNRVLTSNGEICKINKESFVAEYRSAAKRGERVLAVALSEDGSMDKLILVALITMKDKIRENAPRSIAEIQRAGIQIVMITGDSKDTAVAIARDSGIMKSDETEIAIDAYELSTMSDDELKSILPKLRVVARAMPNDKTRLVKLAQDMDMVAGMTGDGINDAPSLKLADVGFAMGSGTDIAKSAADIVIIDNSFEAIKKTVLFGRTIFKSIRKFITFQLTMNLAACGVSLIGQFIGIDTPITIIQMLWVNIIMDTLGGLAFAGEGAVDYYMLEKPKKRDEPILNKDMLHQIGYTGGFTLGMCIFFLISEYIKRFYGFNSSSGEFYTAFYALFIFCGIFNCFAARSERLFMMSNISKNPLFVCIMILILLIQILMIYFGGALFRCVPLSGGELFFVFSLAFMIIPFDCIRRVIKKLT